MQIQVRSDTIADESSFLPSGLVIISKQYWEVPFHCLASYVSPSLAITNAKPCH